MIKHEVMGEEIWECTPDEARALWESHPDERYRIWTTEEFTAHILDNTAQVRACLSRKMAQPGKL